MSLSDEQETRLRLVNELITNDPAAAHALADRWGRLLREETEARATVNAENYPQGTLDLSPEEQQVARQVASRSGQPLIVMDVKVEPAGMEPTAAVDLPGFEETERREYEAFNREMNDLEAREREAEE